MLTELLKSKKQIQIALQSMTGDSMQYTQNYLYK